MLITLIYSTVLPPLILCCSWPISDVLFIIDGTLNLNVYDQLNELDFIRNTIKSMSISPGSVHVALAQYTPKGKLEFNLDSAQSNEEAASRLEGVSYVPCDPFSKTVPCTPVASLNSLAKQGLLPGNRKPAPDIIVLLGSSKYSLPHVGTTEVLFSPISPIHTFQISVGGATPPGDQFEASATYIRMHAVDFNSLGNLVGPLCESVSSFVGGGSIAGFGSSCWIIIAVLCLVFLVVLGVLLYALYAYRNEGLQYRKRLAETESNLRKQNEYFTAKIHEHMEDHIATNKKHADDLRKQQESLQTQQLELHRQLQTSVTPTIPANNNSLQQPIFVPVYPSKEGGGDETTPILNQPIVLQQPNNQGKPDGNNGNTIHLTFDGKEVEVSNGRISTRFLGEGDNKQTSVQFQNRNDGGRDGGYGGRDGQGTHRDGGDFGRTGRDGDYQSTNRGHNDDRRRDGNRRDGDDRRDGYGSRVDGRSGSDGNIGRHGDPRGDGRRGGEGDRTRRERETSEELNRDRIAVSDGELERGRHRTEPTTSRRPKHPISRLKLNETGEGETSARHPNWNSEESELTETTADSVEDSPPLLIGSLPPNHPARTLPPIDILFLVDSSSSIGITNFDAMKENICKLLDDIDIAPGRSRVGLIQYAQEPNVVFGFDKYYSIVSVKKGVQRMSYTGGATMLAKALSFAAGVLYNEQNMKEAKKRHKLMPTPRHDRLQILCVVSDGTSDDNIEKASNYIHEKLQVKVLGMVSKSFNKEKLLPVTRFDGSVFVMTQTESMSIWIWRHQKLFAENYNTYLERSKTKAK